MQEKASQEIADVDVTFLLPAQRDRARALLNELNEQAD